MATQTAQIEDVVDLPQQMIGRNPVVETKFVEQPLLQPGLLPHHPPGPPTVFMIRCRILDRRVYWASFSTVSKNFGNSKRLAAGAFRMRVISHSARENRLFF